MMEVTLIERGNQLYAKNREGELLKVNGLVIPKEDKPSVVYAPESSFFKAACPSGTKHKAQYVSAGIVNIY